MTGQNVCERMHEPSSGKPKPSLFRIQDVLRLTGFGFYFATCLLLGVGVGHWLDGVFHTGYWLLLAGLVLGSFLGFYGMYVMLKPYLSAGKRPGPPQSKG